MGKKGKLSRKSRKAKRNGLFTIFVKNKWNGKESFAEFVSREFKAWNNLPSTFKRLG